jgi:calcineurin-like phosphoesterase family protein
MKTFIVSDTHWDHANIMKYCNRPQASVAEMNADMFKKWNDTVAPDDEVFHLGDVGCWFKDSSWIKTFLPNLHGKKFLIPGNHDRRLLSDLRKHFTVMPPIHNIKVEHEDAGLVSIVLCHYPIWSWEGMFHGSIHCYGHTHSDVHELNKAAVHVGVDTNGFAPVSTDEIVTIVTKRLINND